MPDAPRWTAPTVAGSGQPATALCPVCRRLTTTDMLNLIGALPVDLTGGHPAWCDGCREGAFASGRITREAYYAALGAPASVLGALAPPPPVL